MDTVMAYMFGWNAAMEGVAFEEVPFSAKDEFECWCEWYEGWLDCVNGLNAIADDLDALSDIYIKEEFVVY